MNLMLNNLDGETLLIGILGDPVKQVRSPHPLTKRMQEAGMNAVQLPLHVTSENFHAFVDEAKKVSNIVGFVLTVPHKFAGLEVVDKLTDTARAAGSINLMRREADGTWLGHNADGSGLVEGLIADGSSPAGKVVFVSGAGGAGCGGCAALAAAGARRLRIYDPSQERARALAERIRAEFKQVEVEVLECPDPSGADIAINATPLGMKPTDPLPFEISKLSRDAIVAEFVMKPPVTRLLEDAGAAGHKVSLGENVMYFQQPETIRFFQVAQLLP